ncbi:MAG TPA: hypothetical protein VFJ47_01080 [Terriglobales bacterium]|nr:hypothetical protein [Terriglobales bacterium]
MVRRTRRESSESGISLILALLTLLLITAIAAGLVMLSNTETNISANFRDEQTAFFSARGGIEEVRDRMRQTAPAAPAGTNLWGNINALTLPLGANGSVIYVTNPAVGEVVQPWSATIGGLPNKYADPEVCSETTTAGVCTGTPLLPTGANWYQTPVSSAAAAPYAANPPLLWKWTRINLKTNSSVAPNYTNGNNGAGVANFPVCWNGSNEIAVNAASCGANVPPYLPVFMLTTWAITPSGTHRMVQSEMALVTFPPLPGALTFAGPGATYGSTNSNPFHINGTDTAATPCAPAGNKPAIAAYDNNTATALTGDLARPDHYSGYPPGSSTAVAPSVSNTGPTAPPPGNTMGPLGTVSGLQNLVNAVTGIADQVVPPPGGTPSSLGTSSNPVIDVVQGDVSLASVHGYGILLVEGNANFTGNTSWDGLILIIGNGSLTVSGGGGGQINGGVLVANINTGVVGNTPGPPTVDWSGGGGNGIYYNSCDANSLFNNRTGYFRMVATRELMR